MVDLGNVLLNFKHFSNEFDAYEPYYKHGDLVIGNSLAFDDKSSEWRRCEQLVLLLWILSFFVGNISA